MSFRLLTYLHLFLHIKFKCCYKTLMPNICWEKNSILTCTHSEPNRLYTGQCYFMYLSCSRSYCLFALSFVLHCSHTWCTHARYMNKYTFYFLPYFYPTSVLFYVALCLFVALGSWRSVVSFHYVLHNTLDVTLPWSHQKSEWIKRKCNENVHHSRIIHTVFECLM